MMMIRRQVTRTMLYLNSIVNLVRDTQSGALDVSNLYNISEFPTQRLSVSRNSGLDCLVMGFKSIRSNTKFAQLIRSPSSTATFQRPEAATLRSTIRMAGIETLLWHC